MLRLDDARAFTKLLMANKSLEVGISIEGDSYSFTIDCAGFSDLFQRCYNSLLPRVDVDLIHVAHDDFFRYNEWLSENGQKVVDAMKNAKSTLMKFTFKKAGEITYKFDGR